MRYVPPQPKGDTANACNSSKFRTPLFLSHLISYEMDKLTKQELEEMWWIYYYEATGDKPNAEAADMCFKITDHYEERFGKVAADDWVVRRL